MCSSDRPRQIHGVDFSGAKNAGKKIWIASGVVDGDALRIESCCRAEALPGSGKSRDRCLAALRDFMGRKETAVFGLDFPFGLPRDLVKEYGCWEDFVLSFPDHSSGPKEFRQDCCKAAGGRELRSLWSEMQMIFQDPYSSLNPRMTLFDIVGEPLLVNGMNNRQERMDRVTELLRLVGLRPEYMRRYPHAFSGGERQRIGVARALALNPRLVVADEPVSALDVSVQAQIINLLLELQERLNLTYLFVAHDLSVVKHISDRVAVMYVGKLVEMAKTAELFNSPKHPYTAALLSAVPVPDPRKRMQMIKLEGEVANPADPPPGCYFHPRCRFAVDVCSAEAPTLRKIASDHLVSCHRADGLSLQGTDLGDGGTPA